MSTQIDIDHFRQRLLDERKRVQEAIDYLNRDNSGAIEDVTADFTSGADNHMADTATETVDREIDYTLEENSERVLAEIDAALQRIEDGTFFLPKPFDPVLLSARVRACLEKKRLRDAERRKQRRGPWSSTVDDLGGADDTHWCSNTRHFVASSH